MRAFLDHPTPIAIAHRGGAEELPENTMAAFEAAVAMGYTHLETDAHVSRDGVVFSFHDHVLDRVTERSGRLGDLASGVIAAADAAHHFTLDGVTTPLRGAGHRVPTMEAVLTRWPDVFVNIDVKSDAVAEPLVRLLQRLDVLDRVCLGSFSDRRLRRVRELARGRVCTSMGRVAVAAAWLASRRGTMRRLGSDCVQVPVRAGGVTVIDRAFVSAAHRSRLQVHAWTINDPREMHRLLDLGVDGLMTDRPRLLRDVLVARGQWHGAVAAAEAAYP